MTSVRNLNTLSKTLDQAGIRAVESLEGQWVPGKINGEKADIDLVVTIRTFLSSQAIGQPQ